MPSPVRSPWPDAAAHTRGGVEVRLRPQRRDDRDLVAGFFAALSPASRYRRFLQPVERLSEGMLQHLLAVDGCRHTAVVATIDEECVGIARYVALSGEPGVAEVAVTIADRYQRRGIGRLLVEALRAPAAGAGIHTFVYLVHPDNRSARSVGAGRCSGGGWRQRSWRGGQRLAALEQAA